MIEKNYGKLTYPILFAVLFLTLFLSLSSVNSAGITVTGSNTTSEIQNVITNTNYDIVLEGEFNNLSTLNINRDNIKISGKNAIITRNTSGTNNPLFNITAINVTIENLIIRGYNTAITSNTSDITIRNNRISSTSTAINISTNTDLRDVVIKNNNISTTGTNSYGISLSSNSANLHGNIISHNNINTSAGNAIGIYLYANGGDSYGNTISNNNVSTAPNAANAHGIYLFVNNGDLYNNDILANTVRTRSAHGIYLRIDNGGTMENNNVSYNNVFVNVATQTNSTGIFLNLNSRGIMNNNVVSKNNIEGIVTYTINTNAGARGVDLQVRTGNMTNNVISYNNISINITNGPNSYGIFPYVFTGNMGNTHIYGNNIYANCTAIRVGSSSGTNHLNVSYNRILTSGMFITLDGSIGVNNTASANWFGNNTPDMNRFINIDVLSYYVVNATPIKNTGLVGENWTINYTFYLNNTNNVGDYNKLPFFQAILLNASNDQIGSKIAHNTGIWNLSIEHPETNTFTIVLDNEVILLDIFSSQEGEYPQEEDSQGGENSQKGDTDSSIDSDSELIINKNVNYSTASKNTQGNTSTNIPKETPTHESDNKTNKNVKTNKTNDSIASAAMKETGTPIVILLFLLANLGLIVGRKKI